VNNELFKRNRSTRDEHSVRARGRQQRPCGVGDPSGRRYASRPAGNNYQTSAQADLDSFHSMRTLSTVGYVVGFVGLAGGVVLWLTAPKSARDSTAHAWVGPTASGIAGSF
jgi:hypothetical protein